MAVSVSVANKNKADIWDGNEYKIPKWLVLKFQQKSRLKCACFLYKIHVTLQCIVVSALKNVKSKHKFESGHFQTF
jgi:hypothetical protein